VWESDDNRGEEVPFRLSPVVDSPSGPSFALAAEIREAWASQPTLPGCTRDGSDTPGPIDLRRTVEGLVLVDLTDPMVPPDEANAVFAVLLQQFMKNPVPRKLTVFDEVGAWEGSDIRAQNP
jgi:hypothetical protein